MSVPSVDSKLPDGYTTADCHVFVSNGRSAKLPAKGNAVWLMYGDTIASNPNSSFVPTMGDFIYAIFDWNNEKEGFINPNTITMNWFSKLLQIGLNSQTGKRNQLLKGDSAFLGMEGTHPILEYLDVTNLRDGSESMFKDAKDFNQNLSRWCVTQYSSKPSSFDSGATSWSKSRPIWARCPLDVNIDSIPDGYDSEDCHIIVANASSNFSFPCILGRPIWYSINGVTQNLKEGITETRQLTKINKNGEFYEEDGEVTTFATTLRDGDIVSAIFDWKANSSVLEQTNWMKEIIQFGSRSPGGEAEGYVNPPALPSGRIQNQIKEGTTAFANAGDWSEIKNLDVSNVEWMSGMFGQSKTFNQDISNWDTSNVKNMDGIFFRAEAFNQDLSQWCVSKIANTPNQFDDNATAWTEPRPQWGTCPRGEDQVGNNGGIESNDKWYLGELEAKAVYAGTTQLYPHPEIDTELSWPITIGGVTYEEDDAHIFVANGNPVNLPIPNGTTPVLVAVDGEKKKYETEVKGNNFNGSIIHAIFDWDNANQERQDWFSDIIQFGLNSETEFRNQLKNGKNAFYAMSANPNSISSLYTDNLEDMSDMFALSSFNRNLSLWETTRVVYFNGMFFGAKQFNGSVQEWDTTSAENMNAMFKDTDNFNQDISDWNTISVKSMGGMFQNAKAFNQDLSLWCVSEINSTPPNFDNGATAWTGGTSTRPDWGSCPRLEGIDIPGNYTKADCHIFVANGNLINLPIPSGTLPTFVAVNGVDVTPTTFTTSTVEVEEIGVDGVATTTSEEVQVAAISANDGDIIHAIFDWNNRSKLKQNWFSDILQFGLNTQTGQRKQLADTYYAFRFMEANPTSINLLDVSNARSMEYVFTSSSTFNQSLENWDTSNVTNMSGLFNGATSFNSDLSKWNTSKVENMYVMFYNAKKFNSDISTWNTWKVKNMSGMFSGAESFNQNLSSWCVSPAPLNDGFDAGATSWTLPRPLWGSCPGKNDTFPGGYESSDCHAFVSNGYPVRLPIKGGETPLFVSINGEDVTSKYNSNTLGTPLPGDVILAIFDWNNTSMAPQDWFSDILQFGLNFETGKRNQLKSGYRAFYKMMANPSTISSLDTSNLDNMMYMFKEAGKFNKDLSGWETGNVKDMSSMFNSAPVFNEDISTWDTSNVTHMESMFYNAINFNQDISGWDTSKVKNMNNMFSWAKSFNQYLHEWCVPNVDFYHNFDLYADAWTLPNSRPEWGTCPRGEDGS